jgi:hypothetical protein
MDFSAMMETGTTTDANGVTTQRWEFVEGDRYQFDFKHCHPRNGWKQYDTDQDAWYFGVWVHSGRRQILTFAEGDLSLVTCPTTAHFQTELASMAEFYGESPPAFVAIDHETGSVTKFYDERPTST